MPTTIRLKMPDGPGMPGRSHCNACRARLSDMDLSLEATVGPSLVVSFCSRCAGIVSAILAERCKEIVKERREDPPLPGGFREGDRVKWYEDPSHRWVEGVVEGQDPHNTANLLIRAEGYVWKINNCGVRLALEVEEESKSQGKNPPGSA